jgi:hypothetical protein
MAEVIYYVALPFVASDDAWRLGSRPNVSIPRRPRGALRRCPVRKVTSVRSRLAEPMTPPQAISATPK